MPIKDQHQFRKAEAELKGLEALRVLRPVLWVFGAKGREAARVLAAEQFLEDHYNGEPVDNWLRWYANLPEFRPRRGLLRLAWEDHKAGRYHASVPVVLAQIDGIAYDMANKTFYKQQEDGVVHLTATETVAGDPSGFASLARLISAKRDITETGPISIPYRHGALDGESTLPRLRRGGTQHLSEDWHRPRCSPRSQHRRARLSHL